MRHSARCASMVPSARRAGSDVASLASFSLRTESLPFSLRKSPALSKLGVDPRATARALYLSSPFLMSGSGPINVATISSTRSPASSMSGVDKHLSILPMYSSMIAMLSPIGGRGWMYVGLASGRERVASVGVPRPNPPVWAVDEELTALVAGYASGDVDRLRLRTRHPVGLARALALHLPGAVAPLGHMLVSRGHLDCSSLRLGGGRGVSPCASPGPPHNGQT